MCRNGAAGLKGKYHMSWKVLDVTGFSSSRLSTTHHRLRYPYLNRSAFSLGTSFLFFLLNKEFPLVVIDNLGFFVHFCLIDISWIILGGGSKSYKQVIYCCQCEFFIVLCSIASMYVD